MSTRRHIGDVSNEETIPTGTIVKAFAKYLCYANASAATTSRVERHAACDAGDDEH
jgi:hypothetical protein